MTTTEQTDDRLTLLEAQVAEILSGQRELQRTHDAILEKVDALMDELKPTVDAITNSAAFRMAFGVKKKV